MFIDEQNTQEILGSASIALTMFIVKNLGPKYENSTAVHDYN